VRGFFAWLMVSAVLGGIVHIAAMLVIPALAPQGAFSRFETTLQSNIARSLPPAAPGAMPFPFASPDVTYVLCRYDVTTSPVRFTAPTAQLYWSVGIYEPDGGNYFHINSVQSTSPDMDIILLGRGQEADLGDAVTIARASSPNGLIILRMFMRDRTLAGLLGERAAAARCTAFTPEEPELPPSVPGETPGNAPGGEAPQTTGSAR